jgi:hypothetical protein
MPWLNVKEFAFWTSKNEKTTQPLNEASDQQAEVRYSWTTTCNESVDKT